MKRLAWIVMLSAGLAVRAAGAAEAPVGQWKTVDEKSGAVESVVEIYDQGGKLFGKIVSLTKPTNEQGKPKICTKCTGADKDNPIVGLVIIDPDRHDISGEHRVDVRLEEQPVDRPYQRGRRPAGEKRRSQSSSSSATATMPSAPSAGPIGESASRSPVLEEMTDA